MASATTRNRQLMRTATGATDSDRLNIGPIPTTTKLQWLQPHAGDPIAGSFRSRVQRIVDELQRKA